MILLSRVVIRLGGLENITPKTIEGLFAADLAYLQDRYNQINQLDGQQAEVVCPHCQQAFDMERPQMGESSATPSLN